jgi:hypothetical protein
MREKTRQQRILEAIQKMVSHFCSAKVLFKKIPFPKNEEAIEKLIYHRPNNIVIGRYSKESNEIWLNKEKAVIELLVKDTIPILHEIYHAKYFSKIPKKITVKKLVELLKKDELNATRWAQKQITYYDKHPKKWENLFMKKGGYWKNNQR